MANTIRSIIIGSGSYIPENSVKNEDFLKHDFYGMDGAPLQKENQEIVEKFQAITTIAERRYADDDHMTSDLAYFAAQKAIEDAGIDQETLDYIIIAHNYGDVDHHDPTRSATILPSVASKVKQKLGIENPYCVAYDLPFGCPGWVQGMIQADYYLRSGDAKRALIIGAETLSRTTDPHDRDSMIYSDGAGATIIEAVESEEPIGILAHKTRTDAINHAMILFAGKSYNADLTLRSNYIKMYGRKVYEYALKNVPTAIQATVEKSGVDVDDIKKILIHQANGKMDEAILKRFYRLYKKQAPETIMPMTVSYLGNSSVATVPTLYDLIMKGNLEPHKIDKGDTIVFASVGAGMNINAIVYKHG